MKVHVVVDSYYTKLPSGPPTQGDIWSNLPAAFGSAAVSYGLVITPRCDLAHDKAQFINYLPIVSLKEYLASQGGFELLEHELLNATNTLDRVARDLGIDRLLAAGVSLDDALAVAEKGALPGGWGSGKAKTRVADLRAHTAKVETIAEMLKDSRLDAATLAEYVNHKALTNYKKQIARNTVVDLHFLPPCPPLLVEPTIVLLRCIGTIGKELFTTALKCVTQQDWQHALTAAGSTVPYTIREKPERIVRLRSPHLEALMARFGGLFSRVGTRDLPEEALITMISED